MSKDEDQDMDTRQYETNILAGKQDSTECLALERKYSQEDEKFQIS